MARTKTETTNVVADPISAEAAEVLTQSQNVIANIEGLAQSEFIDAIQAIARSQVHSGYEELSRTARISEMKKIKETKGYRAIKGLINPHSAEIMTGTWEEYCGLMGKSVDQIDRDIANFNAFGAEALEAMEKAGMGYRQMRQLRQLPDDAKGELIEAAKNGDKDSFIELAEEIISKHAKEKEIRDAKIQDQAEELEAKESVAETNRRRIDELQEKIAVIKKLPPDEKTKQICSEITALQIGIDEEIRTNFYNALETLGTHSSNHQSFINAQLQHLDDAVKFLRAQFGGNGVEWEQQQ